MLNKKISFDKLIFFGAMACVFLAALDFKGRYYYCIFIAFALFLPVIFIGLIFGGDSQRNPFDLKSFFHICMPGCGKRDNGFIASRIDRRYIIRGPYRGSAYTVSTDPDFM
jgi:hypothetical protein